MSLTPGHRGQVAVIDIGTNTVRLLVAEDTPGGRVVLDEFGDVTCLGGSLIRTGRIEPNDLLRTEACLIEAMQRARDTGVRVLDIVGTEVFRRATNGAEAADALSSRIGHPIRVLSGEEEADASYLGAVAWSLPPAGGAIAVLDVGGGSTELIRGEGLSRQASCSLPIGALLVTDRWFDADPPGSMAVHSASTILAAELAPLAPDKSGLVGNERLMAVGGSACAAAAWVHDIQPFEAGRVHGLRVSRKNLLAAVGELAGLTVQQRMDRGGLGRGRARLLPGGAALLGSALQVMNRTEFETSVFGLRHGRALLAWGETL